jgi:hypothetical protein
VFSTARIEAFDICKIEKDSPIVSAVGADLVIAVTQRTVGTGAISVAGLIDEDDVRVVPLERRHGVEIGLNSLGVVVRGTSTPGPHDDVVVYSASLEHDPGRLGPQGVAVMPEIAFDLRESERVTPAVHAQVSA